jgi:hypothetical protein
MNTLFKSLLSGNGGRKHKQIEYDEYTVIKPPVKRDLIVYSAIAETRSLVIVCRDRSLAIELNEQYGTNEDTLDWVRPEMYEIIVSELYDFHDVVQYVKVRYG